MYWPGTSDECSQKVERSVTIQTHRNTHKMVETNRWIVNLRGESSEIVCPCDVDIISDEVINFDQSTHCIQLFVTDQTYVITDWMLESASG